MDLGKVYSILQDNRNTVKLFLTALCITLFFSGYIQNILINTCIFGYLGFNTIKFLKKSTPENQSTLIPLMIDLLKQWTCFSVLIVTEYFASSIFSFLFMSIFYNAIKVVGLIMLLQNSQNLLTIYNFGIVPLFNRYEQYIEQVFKFLESKSDNFREVSNTKEVNYSVYTYVEPYVNMFWAFTSSVKSPVTNKSSKDVTLDIKKKDD